MINRTTDRFMGKLFGRKPLNSPAAIARKAGRAARLEALDRRVALEMLEERVLLGVDQPGFPTPWVPGTGQLINLTVAAADDPNNGRGSATGEISSASDDDMFRFVMPGAPGTRDFVTVLANTIPTNSTLDSYIQIYNNSGELIVTGANNGVLSSTAPGVATDGWAGFVGEGGMTYYIRVRSQQGAIAPGRTATGTYTLQIDAATIALPLDTVFNPAPDKGADTFGQGSVFGTLTSRQEDIVYRVTTGTGDAWKSVAIGNAVAMDIAQLDVHLSVYDSGNTLGQVVQLRADRQGGRLTNAYFAFASAEDSTFYFRVRSDELAAGRPSTGEFILQVDMAALDLPIDPVTYFIAPNRQDNIFGPSAGGMDAPPGTGAKLYQFMAQGSGLTIITVIGQMSGLVPRLPDPAIHLYNSLGVEIAFNDDFNGLNPQLELSLTGGERYFLVVEGFDRPNNGAVNIFIESNHTFGPTLPIDDHIDSTPFTKDHFQNATPIIWGPRQLLPSGEGFPVPNPVIDRSWFQTGVGRGRIHGNGDTDLFQFVPPVDMLGEYGGDDGNQGRALYVGGNFQTAGDITSENVAIWDAGEWFFGGPSTEANGAIDGHIYAMTTWTVAPFGTVLVAGGDFQTVNGVPNTNIAFRVRLGNRWIWSPTLDPTDPLMPPINTNGPVFALTTFDAVPDIGGAELIIGGQFTDLSGLAVSGVAAVGFAAGVGMYGDTLGGGVTGGNATVRALVVHDPAQEPDPDGAGPMMQPQDKPAGLYVGGEFTTAGGQLNLNNIARFGRADSNPMTPNTWEPLGETAANGGTRGVNGPVLALASFPLTFVDGMGAEQEENVLVVGGNFANRGGNLAFWSSSLLAESVANRWQNLGSPGAVRALKIWFPPDANLETGDVPLLVTAGNNAGGDGTGLIRIWDGAAFGVLGTSTTGTFRALEAFEDAEPAFTSEFEVLYVGGDFTEIDGDDTVVRAAKFDLGPLGFQWFGLGTGVDGESDAPPTQLGFPTVFAMAAHNDHVAGVWDRNERKASRVSITLSPTSDAAFNSFIRVFDSNLNLIYQNETIAPPFPDPSGAIDGSRPELAGPGTDTAAPGFQVWGGEVYYIEVSASGNTGTGRYTLVVSVDALPPPADPTTDTGVYIDTLGVVQELPGEGQFAIAPEISLAFANGDGRNFLNPHGNPPSSYYVRVFDPTPAGIVVQHNRDLSAIEYVDDTDLYKFRAPATGTVEIRISTLGITSQFQEQRVDILTGEVTAVLKEKTFDSPLDAAIRIFNNDFEEIVSPDPTHPFYHPGADDAYEVAGRSDVTFAGTFGGRTFTHRDPRIVIDVVAGETYFVQVESAFRGVAANPDPSVAAKVDWRHATGAYELLINATPTFNGIDDHGATVPLASPIPIDPRTGRGEISGVIQDVVSGVFQNPNDFDFFSYIATTRGQVQVRVTPTAPLLEAATAVFDNNGNIVASNLNPAPGAPVTLTFFAAQGERFTIGVDGANGSQGSYVVEIISPGITDDHADDGDWTLATGLVLQPFFGTASADGVIENPNDTDVFYYDALAFETGVVTVTSRSGSLDPFVRVWEQNLDGTWNPANPTMSGFEVFLQVAYDDNGGGGVDARVPFSMTAGKRYWFVVSGADPDVHFGDYTITVQVAATDDHPNVTDFPLGSQINLSFDPLTQVGTGSINGRIEQNLDSDMFRFIAPATGTAQVTVTTPDSGLAPRVEIRSAANTVIVVATNGTNGSVTVNIPTVLTNQQYYIVVTPGTTGMGQPDDTGTYTVTVNTSPIDDHPNAGEFGSIVDPRDVITLSNSTGVGTNSGVIVPATDTDLFRFAVLAPGNTTVRVTTPGSSLNPAVQVFNSSFELIASANGNGDSVQVNITAGPAGSVYYVLVLPHPSATGVAAVGTYTVTVLGQLPGGGGPGPAPDDHANAGEFNDATVIPVNTTTGNGQATGVINFIGDTDLFRFTTQASGRVWVQVNVPPGGLIDGRVRIFNASQNQIVQDSAGIPGATAAVSFNATAGTLYYILVEPIGSATGSYSVRLASQPVTHFLYFPEGFSGPGVDEFIPIVNPNPFTVTFSVFAHYETGALQTTPIFSGSIPANSRGGITVYSKSNPGASLVRLNTPYGLEIRSSAQLGATLSRYDFDVSVGESFTNQVSTTWTFAQFHKDPGIYRDFLVFLNPNNSVATATVELFYDDGTKVSFQQTIGANRRAGINMNADGRVSKLGNFGVRITSDLPVVAAQSTYNIVNGGGDGLLGDPNGGGTRGVLPDVRRGSGTAMNLSILNAQTSTTTVTVTASYARLDLPDLVRVYSIPAGSVLNLTGAQFGLLNGQQAGLRYTSDAPVTMNVIQYRNGDGNATNTATHAALEYVVGDAWVNPRQAGVNYLETLGLYNPASTTVQVTVRVLFFDGATSTSTFNVGPDNFAFVAIDQLPAVLSRPGPAAFSLVISSNVPFVASFTHYDLNFNGGWGTIAAPIGLLTSLATV